MTEALTRLLGRATGQVASRLRPRLPTRFEMPARQDADSFVTQHEDVLLGPTDNREPGPVRDGRPSKETTVTQTAARQTAVNETSPLDPAPSPAKPASNDQPTSGLARDIEASVSPERAPPTPFLPPHREPARFPDRAPPQETPQASRETSRDVEPAAPRASLAPVQSEHRNDRIHEDLDQQSGMPPPLMPSADPQDPSGFRDSASLPSTNPGRRAAQSQQAERDAAPPEINIHIGRIELRAETAKPAKQPRRARPERNGSSLGDYLKGGGGRR